MGDHLTNRNLYLLSVKSLGLLAAIYVLGLNLFVLLENVANPRLTNIQRLNWVILFIFWGAFSSLVVGLFSSLIGGLTALIEFKLFSRFSSFMSRFRGAILGGLMCICLTYPINQVFWPLSIFEGPYGESMKVFYLALIGVPSLLYIFAGSWMGFKIAKMLSADSPAP